MTTGKKLEFILVEFNGDWVYLAEPYKVVHYDWLDKGGYSIPGSRWSAYVRIPSEHLVDGKPRKISLFGNRVEKDRDYDTKEEAMEACQRHLNRLAKGG